MSMEKNRIRPIAGTKVMRMSYSRQEEVLEMPNLIEVQKDSYQWFLDEGLKEVFDDISPIADYSGSLSLEFVDFELCRDDVKYSIEECKERDATFAAPLKVKDRLYNKEKEEIIHAIEAHHGDVECKTLVACLVQAADTISAARPGARKETLETYSNRLQQLEDITNSYKGVEKSFAVQAGREVRILVVPEQISDADMVLLARDISKQIETELEYPGQIKVNVIRESRVIDYAK